jgi:hypothetical protein
MIFTNSYFMLLYSRRGKIPLRKHRRIKSWAELEKLLLEDLDGGAEICLRGRGLKRMLVGPPLRGLPGMLLFVNLPSAVAPARSSSTPALERLVLYETGLSTKKP